MTKLASVPLPFWTKPILGCRICNYEATLGMKTTGFDAKAGYQNKGATFEETGDEGKV